MQERPSITASERPISIMPARCRRASRPPTVMPTGFQADRIISMIGRINPAQAETCQPPPRAGQPLR
jgi:hypothetical protein